MSSAILSLRWGLLAGLAFVTAPALPGAVYSGISLQAVDPFLAGISVPDDAGIASVYALSFGDQLYLGLTEEGQLIHLTHTIADGFAWFPIQAGDAVDQTLVIGGPLGFGSFYSGSTIGTSVPTTWDQSFYWGGAAPIYDRTVVDFTRYGWAQFQTRQTADGPILELLANAVEDTGRGIRAGAYISIPEPASATFWLMAILAAGSRRCRPA